MAGLGTIIIGSGGVYCFLRVAANHEVTRGQDGDRAPNECQAENQEHWHGKHVIVLVMANTSLPVLLVASLA